MTDIVTRLRDEEKKLLSGISRTLSPHDFTMFRAAVDEIEHLRQQLAEALEFYDPPPPPRPDPPHERWRSLVDAVARTVIFIPLLAAYIWWMASTVGRLVAEFGKRLLGQLA